MTKNGLSKITVVLCTHNRAELARKALESLLSQTLPRDEFEVILVDNGSTDDTYLLQNDQLVKPLDFTYYFEPQLGLSVARNKGLELAKYGIVAYLDDDAVACPDWLLELRETFNAVVPTPACVGGPIHLIWEVARPKWLPDSLLVFLSYLYFGEEPRVLSFPDEQVFGANMAFMKTALTDVGGFNINLGRKGTCLISGEETLVLHELHQKGRAIFYQPAAFIWHLAPKSRLTKKFFLKKAFQNGLSSVVLEQLLHQFSLKKKLGLLKWCLQNCLKTGRKVLMSRNPREKMNHLVQTITSLGKAFQLVQVISGRGITRPEIPSS